MSMHYFSYYKFSDLVFNMLWLNLDNFNSYFQLVDVVFLQKKVYACSKTCILLNLQCSGSVSNTCTQWCSNGISC
jgi:hypothetical protein